MKKRRLFFIYLIILLFITGCGISREETLKKAKDLNLTNFAEEILQNEVNAAEKYENNYYIIKGTISSIKKEYIKMIGDNNLEFIIPLEKDDLKRVSNSQLVEIAGKLLEIKNDNNEIKVKMDKSYLKTEKFLINGEVKIPTRKHLVNFVDYTGVQKSRTYYDNYKDDEWFLEIGNYKITSAEKQNFKDEGDTIILGKKIEDGMSISVMGKIYNYKEIKDITKIKIYEK